METTLLTRQRKEILVWRKKPWEDVKPHSQDIILIKIQDHASLLTMEDVWEMETTLLTRHHVNRFAQNILDKMTESQGKKQDGDLLPKMRFVRWPWMLDPALHLCHVITSILPPEDVRSFSMVAAREMLTTLKACKSVYLGVESIQGLHLSHPFPHPCHSASLEITHTTLGTLLD